MAATRKLYNGLAVTIKRQIERCEGNTGATIALIDLAGMLAMDLKQDNMAFKTDRFLAACGLGDGAWKSLERRMPS